MALFDAELKAENARAKDPSDSVLTNAYARQREEYRYTKNYALKTAENQVGLTAAEKQKAKDAASGKKKIVVKAVKLDAAQAAALKKQIQDARKEEQKKRISLVNTAAADLKKAQDALTKKKQAQTDAATAAKQAVANKKQADALYALIPDANKTAAKTARRQLQINFTTTTKGGKTVTMDICTKVLSGTAVTGVTKDDCYTYGKGVEADAKQKDTDAKATQDAAIKERKKAQKDQTDKENKEILAFTDQIPASGSSTASSTGSSTGSATGSATGSTTGSATGSTTGTATNTTGTTTNTTGTTTPKAKTATQQIEEQENIIINY